jgi:hypothetical protein
MRRAGDSDLDIAVFRLSPGKVQTNRDTAGITWHVPVGMQADGAATGFSPPDLSYVMGRESGVEGSVPRRRTRMPNALGDEFDDEEEDDGLWLLPDDTAQAEKPSGWGWLADSVNEKKRTGQISLRSDRRKDLELDAWKRRSGAGRWSRQRTAEPVRSRSTDSMVPGTEFQRGDGLPSRSGSRF